MFFLTLRNLVSRLAPNPRRKGRSPGRASFRPRLEFFEDRIVPATVTWTNPAGGAWETASNWSDGTVHRLPGPADDVVISTLNSGAVVTLSSNTWIHKLTDSATQGSLTDSGVSLTLTTASSISNALNFTGGTITGPGDLTVTGPFTWGGGTMSGSGRTNASGGLSITGGVNLDGRTLNNTGAATWSGTGYIYAYDGAVVNNSGTFSAQSDVYFYWNTGAAPTFNNSGTFTKTSSTGTTTIQGLFNNSGTVNVNSGTLALQFGGTDSGSFAVTAGNTLSFSGGYHNLAAASGVSGAGTVAVSGGTVDVQGSFSPAAVSLSGGVVNFFANPVSLATLNMSGGTLLGGADVGVSSALNWSGGTMADVGSTSVAGTATLSITGTVFLDGRTLNNAGAATWTGTGYVYTGDGAVVNNQTGATFAAQSDVYFYAYTGDSPTFNNAGTFTKAASSGTTTMQGLFNNTGTVDVQSGTLALTGGGVSTGGTFTAEAGKTLVFGGGYFTIDSASTINDNGAGAVTFSSGTVDILGTYNVAGTTTISGGVVNFFASPVSLATLNMSGGTLLGGADVAVSSALNWTGGTMADVGSTSVAGTATLTISGTGSVYLDGRTLNNAGAATWSTGGYFYAGDGAVVNNSGTFSAQSDVYFYPYTGDTPVFNNAGTFTKAAGTGTTTMGGVFNNSGTVNVNSGTLALQYGGTDSGSFAVASGKTLAFSGGYHNLTAASSVGGAGAVTFSAGSVDVNGTYNPTGSTTVSATVNFFHNASASTLTNAGEVLIGSGTTLTLTGNYSQTGGATNLFAGTLAAANVSLTGGFFNGLGTVNLGSGTFTNAGLLSLGSNGGIAVGSTGVLTINGNYTQTSAGQLYVYIGGNTAGTQYDQLAVSGTATLNGSLYVNDINGFVPTSGSLFQVLTCGSRSGAFSSTGIDFHFHNPPTYTATGVTVVAN
jgi:hypothetical protein